MNIHLCFLPRRINMQQAALCIYFKCFNFFSGRIVCATYRKNFYSICKKINSTKNFMHVKLIFIYWIPLILWFICDFDFGAFEQGVKTFSKFFRICIFDWINANGRIFWFFHILLHYFLPMQLKGSIYIRISFHFCFSSIFRLSSRFSK